MTQSSTFARANELAAAMFAASATFLAEGGSAAKVHEGDIELQNEAIFPRPLIMVQPMSIHRPLYAGGRVNWLDNEGIIDFTIVRNSPAGLLSNEDNLARDQYEFFGKVLDEFAAQAGDSSTGDSLSIIAVDITACGKPDATIYPGLAASFMCLGRIHWGEQSNGRRR